MRKIKDIWNSIEKMEVGIMFIILTAAVIVLGLDIFNCETISITGRIWFLIGLGVCWILMIILIVLTNIPKKK